MSIKFEFVKRVNDLDKKEGFYKLPVRATSGSAAYDIYNPTRVVCKAHEITLVKTGIKAMFPRDLVLLLVSRSSMPKKTGLVIPNSVGVIDSDYYGNEDNDGEMGFMFYNMKDEDVVLEQGERIGQAMFTRIYFADNDEILKDTRNGGWGSTGVN